MPVFWEELHGCVAKFSVFCFTFVTHEMVEFGQKDRKVRPSRSPFGFGLAQKT